MSARARWKELCIDTTGDEGLGRFWADALGLEFRPDDGVGGAVGDVAGKGIAMCTVPEPKTVKHRVHIDMLAGSIEELEALGATVVLPSDKSGFRWTVMTDPEGGEFCAFLREPDTLPAYRFYALVVDAADAGEIARWWAEVFGVEAKREQGNDFWELGGIPDLPFDGMVFISVPEAKTVKNPIHWDIYADVEDMRSAGATLLRAPDTEISWNVMADPEGNEFCVFAPVI